MAGVIKRAQRTSWNSVEQIITAYDDDKLGINNIASSICYNRKSGTVKSLAKLKMWEEAKQIIVSRNEPLKYKVYTAES